MPEQPKRPADFHSTHWSLVMRVRNVDEQIRRTALDQLLRTYSPALVAYLVYGPWRLSVDEAEELVQGFLTDKVLERDLFAKADPSKGRLRSFLIESLKNYRRDQLRREKPTAPIPDDGELADDDSSDIFLRAWAKQVLDESLKQMQAQCETKGRSQVWSLFEARVVRPALDGVAPVDYETIVQRFDFSSPEKASNALVNAKRHFASVLEEVIGQYTADDEIESEIRDLRAVLAAGPLGLSPKGGSTKSCDSSSSKSTAGESSPSLCSMMFDSKPNRDELWSAEELKQMLEHQLRKPLMEVYNALHEGISPSLLQARAEKSGEPLATLNDLFRHPAPPLEVLDTVKRWARGAARDDASDQPSEISSLIYFAAIAAALLRLNERITKSDDARLRFSFELLLARPSICEYLTSLIRSAVDRLGDTH